MNKILFLFFVVIQTAIGGFERTETCARAAGLGNAYSALADEVSGISFNPAGIADIKRWQGSFYFSPQPFGLNELAVGSVTAGVPLNVGVIGLSLRRYGFDLYREMSATVSYAKIIAGIQIGCNVHYDAVQIKNYGSAGTFGIDAGVIVVLQKNIRWGLTARNINAPRIGSRKEYLPRVFTTGLAYLPLSSLILMVDIQKEVSFLPSTRFGFEYWIFNMLALRSGISEKPTQFSAGIGVVYQHIRFDYAVSIHQELGWTHSFSLTVL
jgi:hypothetical protein